MSRVEPGRVVVFSDIGCPWAHVVVHRLHVARRRLGLEDTMVIEHRAFPLELVNNRPTPKPVLDAEVPVAAALEVDAGWHSWHRPEWQYPVTTLPALAAVQAAAAQGAGAADALDSALRRAFFSESRCISHHRAIVEVAAATDGVDAEALTIEIETGRPLAAVFDQWRQARAWGVQGSPHVFAAGGDAFNPGITVESLGIPDEHMVRVTADDPDAVRHLITRQALTQAGSRG